MRNVRATQEFFNKWFDYHKLVGELDTYRYTAEALRDELHGRVVDVGSGGVLNYDVAQLEQVVIVDIAEELSRKKNWPPNVLFKWGDAVDLPLESNQFDAVLLQLILHHLAEDSFAVTCERNQRAIEEAARVLKPGGRLVIIESCLPKLWERAEQLLFPTFRFFLRCIHHPLVFQWNWNTLAEFTREAGFTEVQLTRIPQGRWVIQLGRKWPTALTPIQLYKLVATKPLA
jgi:ubiquinone/menaquinone biosynthesis C-methylase UbiE